MEKAVFLPADILIPAGVDLSKWSVVACDQFSSEPDYWDRVARHVAGSPSALDLIVPEAYLSSLDPVESAEKIGATMSKYMAAGFFRELENSYVYLERTLSSGDVRRGLVGVVDLEEYDFSPGSRAAVRASEETIVSRLPARVEVRRRAPLEMTHVMALIDDPACRVIEPLAGKKAFMEPLYDFDLMEGGGRAAGWRLAGDAAGAVIGALSEAPMRGGVCAVIGDGNHSLAAAKAYWDEIKAGLSGGALSSHPARYALAELVNVYDPAVRFEAIHRLVAGADPRALVGELESRLSGGSGREYRVVWTSASGEGSLSVRAESFGDFISKLQASLDDISSLYGCSMDYIHGEASLRSLARIEGRLGLLLPAMDKSDLFDTVITRGVFPKKSFSIGRARDKRYYLECRKIR